MNLLEIIADVLEKPDGAFERMESMGVPSQVIDEVLALIRDKVPATVDHDISGQTSIVFENEF